MKLGFSITTKNRPEQFKKCYEALVKYAPEGSVIAVVEDGSDVPYSIGYGDVRHAYLVSKGISAAKNKCLEMLYNKGCDYLFLLDDDTLPLCENWFMPYINNQQPHLCYTFLPSYKKMFGLKVHALANGCMMYFTREVIDTVGGFDIIYNNKFEHIDLSRRIFNAGLTLFQFADVIGSDKLLYCLDQDKAINRSFTDEEMNENLKNGFEHFNRQRNSKEFIEFRT